MQQCRKSSLGGVGGDTSSSRGSRGTGRVGEEAREVEQEEEEVGAAEVAAAQVWCLGHDVSKTVC